MKKVIQLSLLFVTLVVVESSYAQAIGKVFTPKDVDKKIQNHKTFAILPFVIQYNQRSNKKNKLTKEDIEDMTENMAYDGQSALMAFVLKKARKGNLSAQPQNIDETNAILLKKEIDPTDLAKYTPKELCEILEVDSVMGGKVSVSETMSQGTAIVTQFALGVSKTNSGVGHIKLTDKEGELLFSYGKKLSTGLGGDATDIIDVLMKKSANRFPYFLKSKKLIK